MKLFSQSFIISIALFLAIGTASAAPTLYFNPAEKTVMPGEFNIDLMISGGDADFDGGIFAAGAGITYDPAVIRFVSYSLDSIWDTGFTFTDDTVDGIFRIGTEVTSAEDVKGDILIATLTFDAIALGETDLILSDPDFQDPADPGEGDFWDWNGDDPLDRMVNFDATGKISVVPVPSSLLLICGGLLMFVGRKRKIN